MSCNVLPYFTCEDGCLDLLVSLCPRFADKPSRGLFAHWDEARRAARRLYTELRDSERPTDLPAPLASDGSLTPHPPGAADPVGGPVSRHDCYERLLQVLDRSATFADYLAGIEADPLLVHHRLWVDQFVWHCIDGCCRTRIREEDRQPPTAADTPAGSALGLHQKV